MPSSRDAILSGVRRSLKRGPLEDADAAVLADRLAEPKPILVPDRAKSAGEDAIALFTAMAEKVSASVVRIAEASQLGDAVSDYLRTHNQPMELVVSGGPLMGSLDDHPMLTVRPGLPTPQDRVAVVNGLCAVAESGSVMLTSGTGLPSSLNFLPDTHIIVLRSADVFGGLEQAWAHLRSEKGREAIPRSVTLVTGPSRTGDIEQTIQLGAHGPLRLHIVLVDGA
ncbi:MAG: LutC/YkgG family protein [Rhodospirillaceae bacterium]